MVTKNLTLTNLKKHIRLFSLFAFLVFYGITSFYVGRNFSFSVNKFLGSDSTQQNKASGIDSPVQSPLTENDTQAGNVISTYVKLCANATYSFEIAYPKDWFTTYNEDGEKCRYFAPFSFIVPSKTDNTFVPINVEIGNPDSWQETVKFYENPNDFYNVSTSENVEIANSPAKKIKAHTTEEGSLPKNFIRISYLVFDSKSPLVLTYQQTNDDEDTEKMEGILLEMASSLRFF